MKNRQKIDQYTYIFIFLELIISFKLIKNVRNIFRNFIILKIHFFENKYIKNFIEV